jgi:hypothetical protein
VGDLASGKLTITPTKFLREIIRHPRTRFNNRICVGKGRAFIDGYCAGISLTANM